MCARDTETQLKHFNVCPVVDMDSLSDDYTKLVMLLADRSVEVHAQYGFHYRVSRHFEWNISRSEKKQLCFFFVFVLFFCPFFFHSYCILVYYICVMFVLSGRHVFLALGALWPTIIRLVISTSSEPGIVVDSYVYMPDTHTLTANHSIIHFRFHLALLSAAPRSTVSTCNKADFSNPW